MVKLMYLPGLSISVGNNVFSYVSFFPAFLCICSTFVEVTLTLLILFNMSGFFGNNFLQKTYVAYVLRTLPTFCTFACVPPKTSKKVV